MNRKTAEAVYERLLREYPDAADSPASLGRGPPFEVLILTILSAQTTDQAVLKVKEPLFSRYPVPAALAAADPGDVETVIRSLGYFHAKARHIIAAATCVLSRFGGRVPDTMADLLTIPGVGRKTANIVLYHAYGKNEGIAVDTHVRRLAQRIGFSGTGNVALIERDLMALFPEERWGDLTDLLIAHGRAVCAARKPRCGECVISGACRYYARQSRS